MSDHALGTDDAGVEYDIDALASIGIDPSLAYADRHDVILDAKVVQLDRGPSMRSTVTIDGEPYRKALELADPGIDRAGLFCDAVALFIHVLAARRLAALGGSAPGTKAVRRRQPGAQPARRRWLSQICGRIGCARHR